MSWPIIRQITLGAFRVEQRCYGFDYYWGDRWLFVSAPQYICICLKIEDGRQRVLAFHLRYGIGWDGRWLTYMNRNRCYLRGTSPLGLLNTVLGCLFNRVLVRHIDEETSKTVKWSWRKATDFPPAEKNECNDHA